MPDKLLDPMPFAVGSLVIIRNHDNLLYVVISYNANIDTGNTTAHPPNPAGMQHSYVLEGRKSKLAYWYHSQILEAKAQETL
jgi:hypothetical protein